MNPTRLVGGDVVLDADAARQALDEQVAARLGTSAVEAAHGVLTIAVATMMRAVKAVTTYRGRDPRDFAICAFGGNGPLVGVEVARTLEIDTVVVPPLPGVFSALGLVFGDTEREHVRTLLLRSDEVTADALGSALATLEQTALDELARDGHPAAAVTLDRVAELRYAGQAYELQVAVPSGAVAVDRLLDAFVAEHVRTYGHGSRSDPVEVVSVRVVARVPSSGATTYDPLPRIAAQGQVDRHASGPLRPRARDGRDAGAHPRGAHRGRTDGARSSSTSTTQRSSSHRDARRGWIGSATSR